MIIISSMKGSSGLNQSFKEYLKSKGKRNTVQRDFIINEIATSPRHLTAEEIYNNLKGRIKGIGFATVCRNLKLLCEAGLIQEIKIGNQKARYEIRDEKGHHDHLICLKCGRFIEVYSKRIEELQDEMAKKEGFLVINHKLEIYGICKDCRRG